jgi:hypothetical protein
MNIDRQGRRTEDTYTGGGEVERNTEVAGVRRRDTDTDNSYGE